MIFSSSQRRTRTLFTRLLGVLLLLSWGRLAVATPSFPGAEGFGASATGGRGGTVYEVTNLSDSGAGSLRDALSQGNRTIVFRVSGTIDLTRRLDVSKPNTTIAGQTAPGGGICLRNYTFNIAASNVIVRFLRVRLGDVSAQEADSVTIANGARNVILDHCSASWSVDETLSTSGDNGDITIQWCLIAESLRQSVHVKGPHGYGSLARANGAVTWHHNLWAHHDSRNPRLGDNYDVGPYPTFDVRNNVMYDYGATCSGTTQGVFSANYVGNYIRPGPSSTASRPISVASPSNMTFHIRDNVFEGNSSLTADNTKFFSQTSIGGVQQVQTTATPIAVQPVTTTSASVAYEAVLNGVGATLPARDSADARVVAEVRARTGGLIDSQSEVGGWPVLASSPAPLDTDHDGMPDTWERTYGLNPTNADNNGDFDQTGYTNLEKYLNSLVDGAYPIPTLPSPWQQGDVGSVGVAGSGGFNSGTFRNHGGGAGIGGTADAFRFIYQPMTGNGSITARVLSVQNTNAGAKAGVMIRDGLDANSKHALLVAQPGGGLLFERRTTPGGGSTSTSSPAASAFPQWLRLSRIGDSLVASKSVDGLTWQNVGTQTIPMSGTVYFGLPVTSTSNSVLNTSTFDYVTVEASTAVKLIGFAAQALSDGVLLSWRTGLETDNLGFHVYRQIQDKQGRWRNAVRLNLHLIAGSALLNGANADPTGGFGYGWGDTKATPQALSPYTLSGVRYWLQDVETSGTTTNHGPVYAVPGVGGLNGHTRSKMVNELGR